MKAKTKRILTLSLQIFAAIAALALVRAMSGRNTFTYYRYDVSLSMMEMHHELVNSPHGGITAEHIASPGEATVGLTFLKSGHRMTLGNGVVYVYKRYLDREWKNYEQLSIYVPNGQDGDAFDIQKDTSGILVFYMSGLVADRASNCFGYPDSGDIVIHDKYLFGSRSLALNLNIPTQRISDSEMFPCKPRRYNERVTFKLDGCCI